MKQYLDEVLSEGYLKGRDLSFIADDVLLMSIMQDVSVNGFTPKEYVLMNVYKFSRNQVRNIKYLKKYKIPFPGNISVIDALCDQVDLEIWAPFIFHNYNLIEDDLITSKGCATFVLECLKKAFKPEDINIFLNRFSSVFPNKTIEKYILGFIDTHNCLGKASFFINNVEMHSARILYRYIYVDHNLIDNKIIEIIKSKNFNDFQKDLIILKMLYPDIVEKLNQFKSNNMFEEHLIDGAEWIKYKSITSKESVKYNCSLPKNLHLLRDSGLTLENLFMITLIVNELDPELKCKVVTLDDYLSIYEKREKEEYCEKDRVFNYAINRGLKLEKDDFFIKNSISVIEKVNLCRLKGLNVPKRTDEYSGWLVEFIPTAAALGVELDWLFGLVLGDVCEKERILECILLTIRGIDARVFVDESVSISEIKKKRRSLLL